MLIPMKSMYKVVVFDDGPSPFYCEALIYDSDLDYKRITKSISVIGTSLTLFIRRRAEYILVCQIIFKQASLFAFTSHHETLHTKDPFILLFSHVIFIAHTLAEPSEAVNEFFASRQRYREARLSARSRNLLPVANNENDVKWSGALQLNARPSGTFKSVTATWIISSISLPQGATGQCEYGLSGWVGIDGTGTCKNALFQAGIFPYINTDDAGAVVKTETLDVYGWYPAAMVIIDYTVAEGDMIKVLVQTTSSTDAVVVFSNPTTNTERTFTVSAPGPDNKICGNSVEWILELPSGGWQLPNFGKIHLWQ